LETATAAPIKGFFFLSKEYKWQYILLPKSQKNSGTAL